MYLILIKLLLLPILHSIPQTNGLPMKNQVSRFPLTLFRGISDVEVPKDYFLKKKKVCRVVLKNLPKLSLSNLVYSKRFRKTKVKCHWVKIRPKIAKPRSMPFAKTTESTTTEHTTTTTPLPTISDQNLYYHIFRI